MEYKIVIVDSSFLFILFLDSSSIRIQVTFVKNTFDITISTWTLW